jgi:hypothetical protein
MMIPRFRKVLTLEIADRGSPAAMDTKCLALLGGSNENSRTSASGKSTLPSNKAVDDDARERFRDMSG